MSHAKQSPPMSELMSDERFAALMKDDDLPLTDAEISDGWHFCWEMDGLLAQYGGDDCFCVEKRKEPADE